MERKELHEIELSTASNEEIAMSIASSIGKIAKIRETIGKLEQERKPSKKETKEKQQEEEVPVENSEMQEFENRIGNINEQLNSLDSSEWSNYLSLIPKNQLQRVILGLKLLILKNIKELKEYTDDPSKLTEKDKEMLRCELDYEQAKLKYIDEYSMSQEDAIDQVSKEEIESNQMRLIFIKNEQTGKYGIFDDISEIPTDYYKRFHSSFKTLKRDQGGNIKPLTELYGLSEIKGKGTRIVFKKLSKNCYAIVTAFLKKTNSDRRYSNNLLKKANEYRINESYLLEAIKDEQFLQEQSEIEKTLLDSLATRTTYTASKVKSKVGDNDGRNN